MQFQSSLCTEQEIRLDGFLEFIQTYAFCEQGPAEPRAPEKSYKSMGGTIQKGQSWLICHCLVYQDEVINTW